MTENSKSLLRLVLFSIVVGEAAFLGGNLETLGSRKRSLQGFGVFGVSTNVLTGTPTPAPATSATLSPTRGPSTPPTKAPSTAPTRAPSTPPTTTPPTTIGDQTSYVVFSYRIELFFSDNNLIVAIDESERLARKRLDVSMRKARTNLLGIEFSPQILDDDCTTVPPTFEASGCSVIETDAYANLGAAVDPSVVGLLMRDEVRKSFVEDFNTQSSKAWISFVSPVVVTSKQFIQLEGVEKSMDGEETQFFLSTLSLIMDDMLMKLHSNPVEFEFLQAEVVNEEIRGPSPEEPFAYNDVHVQLRAVCSNSDLCTDDTFQSLVDAQAPSIGRPLYHSLLIECEDGTSYFETLEAVFMSGKPVATPPFKTLPPPRSPESEERKRIPLWVWMLVLVDAVIIVAVVSYLHHRHKRNRQVVQGEKLKDPAEQQPKRIHLPTVPFQMKHKSQTASKQQDDTGIEALDLQDDEYDAKSYDFSVEAADLSNGEFSAGDEFHYNPHRP